MQHHLMQHLKSVSPSPRRSRRALTTAVRSAARFESLELRQLMCFDNMNALLPTRVQAMFDDSGHITATQYAKLNREQQALIGLHQVEDDRPEAEQLAELHLDQPGSGSGDGLYALPDLVPLTGGSYLNPFIDKTEQPGRNLMRFTTAVGNQGEGPVTLFSGTTPEYVMADGTQLVKQRLFNYNNNTFTQTDMRDAGRFVYHPTHGHFHFENYARYRLLTTAGDQVYRADGTAAIGDKVGFCLINIASSFTTTAGTSSTTLPGYNGSGQPSTGCGFLQGISVGRADVYDSQYDGQWIDVTGVPNGNYKLEVTLDAGNAVLETNEANNTVVIPYTLNTTAASGGITLDRFETPTPNNDFAHATDLGEQGVSSYAGLTMHADSDADYFKFTAASSGTYNVGLVVADKLVDVYLYDSLFKELGRNTTPTMATSTSPVTKNISYTFQAGSTYYVRAEGFSGSGTGGDTGGLSNNYTLKLAVNPTVRSSAPIANAGEDSLAEGSIRIARNGPSNSALAVNFTVGGTATRGVDYDLMYNGSIFSANTMTIGVESLGETLRVVPRADALVEATETVILTLAPNAAAYVVGADAPTATVLIADAAPRVTASAFGALTNTVRFDFSLDVSASLSASDLLLTDSVTGVATTVAASSVAWDAATNSATFTLNGVLPRGSFRATLAAASVTHAQGAPLAADATVTFNYVPADTDLSGTVDFADLLALAQHYGSAGTFAQGDVNYDGVVNFDDLLLLSQNYASTPEAVQPTTAQSTRRGRSTGQNAALLA